MRIERLKQTREAWGLSQEDLAVRVDISSKQIWRYENGVSDPTADVLRRIAEVLEVSTDYLVGLVDEPTGHLSEEPINPEERHLLGAFRRGDWREGMRIFSEFAGKTS